MKYKVITVAAFWKKVESGFDPPRHCFLIMEDGSQDWGYPMFINGRRFFDHSRQGGHFKKTITHVVTQ